MVTHMLIIFIALNIVIIILVVLVKKLVFNEFQKLMLNFFLSISRGLYHKTFMVVINLIPQLGRLLHLLPHTPCS
jgi:hypothetical protein